MRNHISKEEIAQCLVELEKRIDYNAIQQLLDSGIDIDADHEVHVQWSDGVTNGTFENNHGCWELCKVVS